MEKYDINILKYVTLEISKKYNAPINSPIFADMDIFDFIDEAKMIDMTKEIEKIYERTNGQ